MLDLRTVEAKRWAHEVREGFRVSLWRQAEKRRADMAGLYEGGGVDQPGLELGVPCSRLDAVDTAVHREKAVVERLGAFALFRDAGSVEAGVGGRKFVLVKIEWEHLGAEFPCFEGEVLKLDGEPAVRASG